MPDDPSQHDGGPGPGPVDGPGEHPETQPQPVGVNDADQPGISAIASGATGAEDRGGPAVGPGMADPGGDADMGSGDNPLRTQTAGGEGAEG